MSTSTLTMPEVPDLFDVAALDAEDFYEIIDGQRMFFTPPTAYGSSVATRLLFALGSFDQNGEAVVGTRFHLRLAQDRTRNRRPDLAFVSFDRWPADKPQPQTDNAWDVVPDLAIEVISPTDSVEDMFAKVSEYFRSGVLLVWVVMPVSRQAFVFDAPNQVRMVTDADSLDGGSVVPGFLLPLADLVDRPQPAAPAG